MKTKAVVIAVLSLMFLVTGTSIAQNGFPQDCLGIPEIMPGQNPGLDQHMNRGTPRWGNPGSGEYKLMADDDAPPVKVCPTDSAVATIAPGAVSDPSSGKPLG